MNENPDNNPSLVVPIDVEAMLIGKGEGKNNTFTPTPYQFDLLKRRESIPLSKHIYGEATASLPSGIYIHWALPDGLTRGVEDGGNVEFPVVPNRWLLTRMLDGDETKLKHWVVESDYLSNKPEKGLAIPGDFKTRKTAVKYLGRTVASSEWKEEPSASRFENLTAMGYGIPEFAASYQHSKGIFSFYDDMKGIIDKGIVSYTVVGWYENYKKKHPLSDLLKAKIIAEKMESYSWCLPLGTTAEKLKDIYCSGSISGISWNENTEYLKKTDLSTLKIGAGHTDEEALSQLLVGNKKPIIEETFNLLQHSLLQNPNTINAIDDSSAQLHKTTFNSTDGGIIWQIDPDPDPKQEEPDKTKSTEKQFTDVKVLQKLDEFNAKQKELERLLAMIKARKKQLYLYWTASLRPNKDYQGILRSYIKEELEKLKEKQKEALDIKSKLSEMEDDVNDKLLNSFLVLNKQPGPRYHVPVEPVIMFQHNELKAPSRYGGDGEYTPKKQLVCRLSTQLVDQVTYDGTNYQSKIKVKVKDDLDKLIADQFFINPKWLMKQTGKKIDFESIVKEFITPESKLASSSSSSSSSSLKILLELRNKLKEEHFKIVSLSNRKIKKTTFRGIAPSQVGVNFWKKNPWLPLYFKYDVTYQIIVSKPVKYSDDNNNNNNFNTEYLTKKFSLKTDDERLVSNPIEYLLNDGVRLQNEFLLSGSAIDNFKERVREMCTMSSIANDHSDLLEKLFAKTESLPDFLSQSLFGLNEALLNIHSVMQLPVVNFDANNKLDKLVKELDREIGKENNSELKRENETQHFFPLSSGILKIDKLTIVDVFGRHMDVTPKPNTSKKLKLGANVRLKKEDDSNFFLSPRIVHPTRLNANWLWYEKEPKKRQTTPVSGWLIPNFLDESIFVFDHDGILLGELTTSDVKWQEPPGSTVKKFEEALKNMRPSFQEVALYFYNKNKKIKFFLNHAKKRLLTNQPEGYKGLNPTAFYLGIPLAVGRIEIGLELEGLPPIDFSEKSILAELKDATTTTDVDDPRDVFASDVKFNRSRGLEKVKIPVQVGDDILNDGLIAYFRKQSSGNLFYYTHKNEQKIRLNEKNLELTVIFDPRNAIHLKTGLLPIKKVRLTPQFYQKLIDSMQLALEISSLLVAAESDKYIQMPLPDAGDRAWDWHFKEGEKWDKIKATEKEDQHVNEGFHKLTAGWLKINKDK